MMLLSPAAAVHVLEAVAEPAVKTVSMCLQVPWKGKKAELLRQLRRLLECSGAGGYSSVDKGDTQSAKAWQVCAGFGACIL
jgi:hypothetical protein